MRSKLGRSVRRQFEEQLHAKLPQFTRDRAAQMPPGWNVYGWQARHDLTCYLVLCIAPKEDCFTVECAWSLNGRFPTVGLLFPRDIERSQIHHDEPKNGEFYFRLAYLWQDKDHWWWLVPEEQVKARMNRFADAVIAADDAEVLRSLEEPPIEEAMTNVQPMVDDAIEKIVVHALPYFEQVKDGLL